MTRAVTSVCNGIHEARCDVPEAGGPPNTTPVRIQRSRASYGNLRAVKRSGDTWLIEGATCKCGGILIIDRCGSRGEFLYETYCKSCRACDCNGWPTILDCLKESPAYFCSTEGR